MTPTTPPSPTVGDVITIPRPHVPYGPVGVPEATADADAASPRGGVYVPVPDWLRERADRIEAEGSGR